MTSSNVKGAAPIEVTNPEIIITPIRRSTEFLRFFFLAHVFPHKHTIML